MVKKKSKSSNAESLKRDDILLFLIGIILGAISSYIYVTNFKPRAEIKVSAETKSKNKKELIADLLVATNVSMTSITNNLFPLVQQKITREKPDLVTNMNGNNWNDLKADLQEKFLELDRDYLKNSEKFYEEFNEEELATYLAFKQLNVTSNIESSLLESAQDFSNNKERSSYFLDLVMEEAQKH